jgi:hypothetical protein
VARIIWSYNFRPAQSHELSSLAPDGQKEDTPRYRFRDAFTAEKEGPVLEFQLRRGVDRPWESVRTN